MEELETILEDQPEAAAPAGLDGSEQGQDPAAIEADPTETPVLGQWEQDGRYESMWNKSPENLYKSYKDLEKKLNDNGNTIRSEYDGKMKDMTEKLGRHEQLENYLSTIEAHPELSKRFTGMIEDFNKQLNREKYGSDLPQEAIDKFQELDSLKEHIQNGENEKLVNENLKVIDQQFDEMNEIAKKYNFTYDEQEFLAYAKENDVKPSMMKAVFLNQVLPQIENSIVTRTQEATLKNDTISKGAGRPKGGKPTTTKPQSLSLDGALRDSLKHL